MREGNGPGLLANDNGIGELVVPTLLAAVNANPDDPQEQRQHGDKIRQVSSNALKDAGLGPCSRVDDYHGESHLSGCRGFKRPKGNGRDGGESRLVLAVRMLRSSRRSTVVHTNVHTEKSEAPP